MNHRRRRKAFRIRGQRRRDGESIEFTHPQFVLTSEVPSSTRGVDVELFRVFGCSGRSGYRALGKRDRPNSIQFLMTLALRTVTWTQLVVNVLVPGSTPESTHPVSDVSRFWPPLPFKNHAVHPSASGFAGLLYHQQWFLDAILRECGLAQPMLVLYRSRLARSETHFTAERLVPSSGPAALHESIFRPLSRSFCLHPQVGYDPWGYL